MAERWKEERRVYPCMEPPPHVRRVHSPEDDPAGVLEQRTWRSSFERLLRPLRGRFGAAGS